MEDYRLNHYDLCYPWQGAATTHATALDEFTRQWVIERGLLQSGDLSKRYDHLELGLLASLTYPETPIERLKLISTFFAWIFIQDDHYDEAVMSLDVGRLQRKINAYAAVIENTLPSVGSNSVIISLAEIIEQLRALTTPLWMDRFSNSMRHFWTDGVLQETQFRLRGSAPSVDSYMQMRIQSVCVFPVLDLIEFSQGFELPKPILEHRSVQQLRLLAARIITYTNDIFSYQKERSVMDPNNLIHLLMHHQKMNFADAVDRVVRMHNKDLELFNEVAKSLCDSDVGRYPDVGKYVQGHRAWIRGALDWQVLAQRYATGRIYLDGNVHHRPSQDLT